MSTQIDQANTVSPLLGVNTEGHLSESQDARIARLERMGARLFDVAYCFVSFGNLRARFDTGTLSGAALAASFCDGIAFQDGPRVLHDLQNDAGFATHQFVQGAPFIRFYASVPLFGRSHRIIGGICLVDDRPHTFDEADILLLADLAVMMEREIALAGLYESHLDLIKQNRNLKRESMIDPLLGTWNKAAILRSLRIEMERCAKAEKPLSLVFVSWDQNTIVRNQYGVATADMMMLKMVSRIRSCVRPFDALGRYDNDIFLIVLPGASNLVVTAVAQRIKLSILSHPETIDDISITLSVSVSVISTDVFPDAKPEFLIGEAEKALLSAKNAGHHRIETSKASQTDQTDFTL